MPEFDLKKTKEILDRSKIPIWRRKGVFSAIGIILLIILVAIIGGGYFVYSGSQSSIAKWLARTMPYPAATVDGAIVTMSTYQERLAAAMKVYDRSQELGNIPASDIENDVLERIIDDAIVAKLAREYGVPASEREVTDELGTAIAFAGGEDQLQENLEEVYGWDQRDYKEAVIRPLLERTKLKRRLLSLGELRGDALERAEAAKDRLDSGAGFIELAKEVSDGPSALSGGDLGFVKRGQMVPEFERAAFSLAPGQVSDPVETEFGYHLILVEEKRGGGELDEIKVRHILFAWEDFESWLAEQKTGISIHRFL